MFLFVRHAHFLSGLIKKLIVNDMMFSLEKR